MSMGNGAGGHQPVDGEAVDVVARITGELREAIEAEQLGRAEYERLVSDSRVREDRLKRSLKALEGAGGGKAEAPERRKSHATWSPSEKNIERVWTAFRALYADRGEALTKTEVGAHMSEQGNGTSSVTLAKVFDILRERELVRPAGRTRGGGTRWAPMPRDEEAQATPTPGAGDAA